MAIFIALLIPLLVLAVVSMHVAFAGNLEGRAHLGWILLIVSCALTYEFIGRWMATHPGPTTKILVGCVGAILFGAQTPLLVALITHTFSFRGTGGLKLLEVHSRAEQLISEDDLPGAIAEYEDILTQTPDDLDVWILLADLLYKNGEHRRSAGAYEVVLNQSQDLAVHRHCLVLTRLSELYAHHLDDMARARGFVETIIREHPGTKYARYASDRLNNM